MTLERVDSAFNYSTLEVDEQLKGPHSAVPAVREFDAAKCTVNDLVAALRIAGGVIVRGMLDQEELRQIENDVRPWLNRDKPWDGLLQSESNEKTVGDFYPPETRRACGLVGKSRTYAERLVGNELWIAVCDSLLTSELKHTWLGDRSDSFISRPQLSNTIAFSIGPGARDQALHRDDAVFHWDKPAVASHSIGRDASIGLFVAGKKTTKTNGATRFIPGSHLWDYSAGPPREEQTVYAELEPGDGLMLLSGCLHGGSANRTEDEERLVYSNFYTRAWLRQEENQFLSHDIAKLKELPRWLQERLGFEVSEPFLGWVNLTSPMLLLHPEPYQLDDTDATVNMKEAGADH